MKCYSGITHFTSFTPFFRNKIFLEKYKMANRWKYISGCIFIYGTFSCNCVRNTIRKYERAICEHCTLLGNNIMSIYTNIHTHSSIIIFKADVDKQKIWHDIGEKFLVIRFSFSGWKTSEISKFPKRDIKDRLNNHDSF